MNIGNKIKALRLKSSTTQEALADALGVSSQSISKWENNVCAPDISLLPSISEFFGVTIDELFDLSVEQKLHRIENMLDYESELTGEVFNNTKEFLLDIKDDYDESHPKYPEIGRNYLFLMDNLIVDHRTKEAANYLASYSKLPDHNAVLVPIYEAYIAFAEYRVEDAWKIVSHIEEKFHDSYDAMFEVAGIYASNAKYDEALEKYHKAEEIYVTNHKEHICMDHLQAQARIYEILGKFEDAIKWIGRAHV